MSRYAYVYGSWSNILSIYDQKLVEIYEKVMMAPDLSYVEFLNNVLSPLSLHVDGAALVLDTENSALFFLTFGEYVTKNVDSTGLYYVILNRK